MKHFNFVAAFSNGTVANLLVVIFDDSRPWRDRVFTKLEWLNATSEQAAAVRSEFSMWYLDSLGVLAREFGTTTRDRMEIVEAVRNAQPVSAVLADVSLASAPT